MTKNSKFKFFLITLIFAVVFCYPIAFVRAKDDQLNKPVTTQANDDNGRGNAEQNRNGEEKGDKDDKDDGAQINGEKHRNTISTFVKNVLNVANRDGNGIGEQVRNIARSQDESKEKIAEAIDKVNKRNMLKTFLIGTDYKNIGQLRSEMVKVDNDLEKLSELLAQTTNVDDKASLQVEIQKLTEQEQKINNFIKNNESKFSLFGWFVKLFNK